MSDGQSLGIPIAALAPDIRLGEEEVSMAEISKIQNSHWRNAPDTQPIYRFLFGFSGTIASNLEKFIAFPASFTIADNYYSFITNL